MKNMINTTLVAVAVAIAMVGSVDAKQTRNRSMMTTNQPMTTTTTRKSMTREPMTKKEKTADANESASIVLQASEQAMEKPTVANKEALMQTVRQEADTPAKEETIVLAEREKKLMLEIEIIKNRIKDIGYGWVFNRSEDTRKAHMAAKDRLADLTKELSNVRADLKANEKETSRSWVAAAKDYAVTTLLYGSAAVIIGSAVYEGYRRSK